MQPRFEKSRSDLEIVYGRIHNGQMVHEIGLPDGTIVPYEQYINNPPPRTEKRITADTPADLGSRISSTSVTALLVAASIFLIIVFHAV